MEENLSLYHIFYVTAREGNISRAARELFISQPAISKAIRKLEENLETVLFIRTSRGVTLTREGELLYRHVAQAFDTLQSGEKPFWNATGSWAYPSCASGPAPPYAAIFFCPT